MPCLCYPLPHVRNALITVTIRSHTALKVTDLPKFPQPLARAHLPAANLLAVAGI